MASPTPPHRTPHNGSDGDPGSSDWVIRRWGDDASTAHQRALPDPLRPTVWIERPPRPALVLGSTQSDAVLDAAGRTAMAEGWEVTKRRSGGGLVVIDPEVTVWVDVIVPRGHPRWRDDIGTAFHWVGEAWARALRAAVPPDALPPDALPPDALPPDALPPDALPPDALPPDALADGLVLHRGAAVSPEAGRVVCFAGLGHGELTVGGSKVLGLSQRRTRDAARIQGLAVLHHDPAVLGRVLSPGALPGGADPLGLRIGLGLERDVAASLVPLVAHAVADALVSEGHGRYGGDSAGGH